MKILKNLLCIMLVACFILSFAACTGKDVTNDENAGENTPKVEDTEEVKDTEEAAPVGFKVTVVDDANAAVAGVVLQICKDTCVPSVTGADGVANFNVEVTSEHKLSVLTLPEGYEYTGEAEIYLEDGMTEFTVVINKVA
ncbi:MAG: hypothetical protein IJB57_08320 [Clostridia bacterium]|nr:hypothetical protein [Clostridia bacterium]